MLVFRLLRSLLKLRRDGLHNVVDARVVVVGTVRRWLGGVVGSCIGIQ